MEFKEFKLFDETYYLCNGLIYSKNGSNVNDTYHVVDSQKLAFIIIKIYGIMTGESLHIPPANP